MKVYFYNILIYLFTLTLCESAYAFRGEGHIEQKEQEETPVSQFPGFFDTTVAHKGAMVMEVPTFSFDYGLTDDLTVGTSSLPLALTALGNGSVIAFLGKARYRYFSNERFSSSITGYFGGIWLPFLNNDQSLSGQIYGGTHNTSWNMGEGNYLLLQLGLFRANLNASDSIIGSSKTLDSTISGNIFFAGLGYQKFFSTDFGFELEALTPMSTNISFNSDFESGMLSSNRRPVLYRIMVDIRTGEPSVLSLGAFGLRSAGQTLILPMLTWSIAFSR